MGVEDVLHAQRQAVQRRIRGFRLRERDARHEIGPGAHLVLARRDALEAGAKQILGGELSALDAPRRLPGAESVGLDHAASINSGSEPDLVKNEVSPFYAKGTLDPGGVRVFVARN